ncbi:MAG: hypothetical protein JXR84_04240 [Anaerolineae bacterium]|nr:hypothetical protein [Anaerolineae bacterium]
MIRFLVAFMVSVASSALFYKPTHHPNVPELARYTIGGVLVLAVLYLLYGDEDEVKHTFMATAIAGLGVATNRIRLDLED